MSQSSSPVLSSRVFFLIVRSRKSQHGTKTPNKRSTKNLSIRGIRDSKKAALARAAELAAKNPGSRYYVLRSAGGSLSVPATVQSATY